MLSTQILKDIYTLLVNSVHGVATEMKSNRFSNDRNFNFIDLGNKKGVRNFSIRNTGGYDIIIEDCNEVIPPGQAFTIIGNQRVVNTNFKVSFGSTNVDATKPFKEAIARYTIDVC
jgi:hypothetical protein